MSAKITQEHLVLRPELRTILVTAAWSEGHINLLPAHNGDPQLFFSDEGRSFIQQVDEARSVAIILKNFLETLYPFANIFL